jgi:hypothetical protein
VEEANPVGEEGIYKGSKLGGIHYPWIVCKKKLAKSQGQGKSSIR